MTMENRMFTVVKLTECQKLWKRSYTIGWVCFFMMLVLGLGSSIYFHMCRGCGKHKFNFLHLILSKTLSHWRCTFNILKFNIFVLIHIFLLIKLTLYQKYSTLFYHQFFFFWEYLICLFALSNKMSKELNKKEDVLSTSNFNFLSNNVKGLQLSKQWLKLFQFFKNKISSKGIVFTRNTFFENHENIWSNKFNGDL